MAEQPKIVIGKAKDDRLVIVLRVITVVCGVALIALSILKFTSFSVSGMQDFFLTIYYILFGILACLSEMPCDKLMSCFFFLKFYSGKAIFFLFLGTITFSLSNFYFLAMSIVFLCAAGMYFIFVCTCKDQDFSITEEKPKENYDQV